MSVKGSDAGNYSNAEKVALRSWNGGIYLIRIRYSKTRNIRNGEGIIFIDLRLAQQQINTALIDPGKPWQNGADERFNGKFRNE